MKPFIVMTVIGSVPREWQPALDEIFPAPPGYCWRFVPEGTLAVQLRSIVRIKARAVAVWVGEKDAIDRAVKLVGGLLRAGPPSVIAIAQAHDACTESMLRQAGALYLCANEARRLGEVLQAVLGPPGRSADVATVESTQEVKMDTG